MLRRTQPVSGSAAAAVALALVIVVSTGGGMSWFYPRLVTTVAAMIVSLLAALIVRSMLPRSWRPPGVAPVLLAGVAAYGFIRFGVDTGSSGFLDHQILTPLEGELDEFSTWFFGAVGAIGLFVFLRAVARWSPRRADDARRSATDTRQTPAVGED
jgi:hypothetical protein